jgi:hypothetical protein
VQEQTIKRPILGFKLAGDRPLPVILGFPIELDVDDENCVSAVAGAGMLVDVVTGQAHPSDAAWLADTTKRWAAFLQRQKHHTQIAEPVVEQHRINVGFPSAAA